MSYTATGGAAFGDPSRAQDTHDELERKPTVSLVEMQPSVPLAQKDAWKSTPEGRANPQLIEVLQAILPPKVTKDEATGVDYVQQVSFTPSSRDDVIALQLRLDQSLQERQASESGLCPVREELYAQTFDELLRQVALESPERGLLLLRVRDEARMSIAAYEALYQAAMSFGTRKTLQAEHGQQDAQAQISELESAKRSLETQVQDLRGLLASVERRAAETRALAEKKKEEELEFLTYQAQHLEAFLKSARE